MNRIKTIGIAIWRQLNPKQFIAQLLTLTKDNTTLILFILLIGLVGLAMLYKDFPDKIELKVTFITLILAVFGPLLYRIQERSGLKRSIKNHIATEIYSSLLLLISGTNELAFNLYGLNRLKEHTDIVDVGNASEIFFIYAQLEHYEDIWKNRKNYDYDYYILEKKFQVICYILHFIDSTDWKRFVSILSWKVRNLDTIRLESNDDLSFVKEYPKLYYRISSWIDPKNEIIVDQASIDNKEITQKFLDWIVNDVVKGKIYTYKQDIHNQIMKSIR